MNITLKNVDIRQIFRWIACNFYARNARGPLLMFTVLVMFYALLNTIGGSPVEASSHQVNQLEISVPSSKISKTLSFPVYEQKSIRYFSAGLGKEERSLSYPPFSLKLIFVQGERAYLAGVTTEIANEDGSQLLSISGKDVQGPWLFIDLPTGMYIISATSSSGQTIQKTVTVQSNTPTKIHMRFP